MGKLTIRKMSQPDLEKVSAIEEETFADPWSYEAFATDLSNDMALPLVAEMDDAIVAYACLYVVGGEAQLGNFAVDPGRQRRGIARKFLNSILEMLRQRHCTNIYLEVRESNSAAIKLYEAFGFHPVSLRKGYYVNPRENAIVMVREIR